MSFRDLRDLWYLAGVKGAGVYALPAGSIDEPMWLLTNELGQLWCDRLDSGGRWMAVAGNGEAAVRRLLAHIEQHGKQLIPALVQIQDLAYDTADSLVRIAEETGEGVYALHAELWPGEMGILYRDDQFFEAQPYHCRFDNSTGASERAVELANQALTAQPYLLTDEKSGELLNLRQAVTQAWKNDPSFQLGLQLALEEALKWVKHRESSLSSLS